MTTTSFSAEAARERFSSLRSGFAFFDAPGGPQVPDDLVRHEHDDARFRAGSYRGP